MERNHIRAEINEIAMEKTEKINETKICSLKR